jgi:hypothetical protein
LPVTTTGRVSFDTLRDAAATQGYVLTPAANKPAQYGARPPANRLYNRDRQGPSPAAPYNARPPQRPYQQPRQLQPAKGAIPRNYRNSAQRNRRANAVQFDTDAEADGEYVTADNDEGYESAYDPTAAHHTARAAYLASTQEVNGDDEESDADGYDGDGTFER